MTKVERRKMWEKRVAAFNESDQTQRIWCEEHNVNLHQLRYWLKKFRAEKLFDSSSSQWVPVKMEEKDDAPESSSQPITVRVGAATIEVQPGFDPKLLANVVKALH